MVAPILFLLLFGIIEFGRALNYYNDLTQLSGQGARATIVNWNPDNTQVSNDPRCSSPSGNNSIQCQIAKTYPTDTELKNGISVCIGTLNQTTGLISAPASTPAPGDPITVRTKFKFNFLTKFFGFGSITLSSTQTERNEAPNPTWAGGSYSAPDALANGVDACTK